MKTLVWGVFVLLAVFWTGFAFIAAEVIEWASASLGSGAAVELGRSVAQLPVPSWIAFWFDPQWIRTAQGAVLANIETLRAGGEWLGVGLGWLVPLVWIVWGLGLLMLLAMTATLLGLRRIATRRHNVVA